MQGIKLSVEGLQASLQRVRGEVTELCSRVRLLCTQAQNLHAAADVLRAVLLRLKLVARLRACQPAGALLYAHWGPGQPAFAVHGHLQ